MMKSGALTKATSSLNRLNDRLFKYIFASRQHKANLIRFLNDVLSDPGRIIVDIEFIDREIDPPVPQGKGARFDVRAQTTDGRIFHVEVQIGEEEDFLARCLFYTCTDYISQLAIGEPYGKLGEVVFIAVLNFTVFPDKPDAFHSVHKMLDVDNHKCYCEGIEMHFLEIPKWKKQEKKKTADKMTGLERMLTYMGTVGESNTLSQIAAFDPDVQRILHMEEMFVSNPQTWATYLRRERELSDWENYVKSRESKVAAQSKAEGKAEGIVEGEAKGKAETAVKLLNVGMDKKTISEVTGLSLGELQKLEKVEEPTKGRKSKKRT
jgi:predicted transposase/invertase (TIGR01784 family)